MSASLRERVIEQIDPAVAATVSREVLRRQIEEIIHGIANEERLELSAREQLRLADELANDMTGFGPLRPLLLDDTISDIMVNGPNNVYVERHGKLERVAVRFRDNDHIASVAQKIASRVGRRIDESSPMVDAACQTAAASMSSSRRWRSTAPAFPSANSPAGAMISAGMIENGTMTPAIGRLLGIAARSRLNVLVSGGTGSGKTTLLNAHEPIHRSQRAHRHHRGRGGVAAAAAACDPPGDPAAEPGRHRTGDAARSGVERAAHAP